MRLSLQLVSPPAISDDCLESGAMSLTRSEIMSRICSTDTSPEVYLRKALWREGLRYRVNYETPVCKADIVFPLARIAVFVDGCYWHGCPLHYIFPRTHREYWKEKLRNNLERDRRQTMELEKAGWTVLRVWEHEVCESTREVVDMIAATRHRRRRTSERDQLRLVDVEPVGRNRERRQVEPLRSPGHCEIQEVGRVSKKWRNRIT